VSPLTVEPFVTVFGRAGETERLAERTKVLKEGIERS
jgi:hypothetical protein